MWKPTVKCFPRCDKMLKSLGEKFMNQPTLFESNAETAQTEEVLLYALGDFQSRGLVLADRELPLDRLLGAFKRAFEHFRNFRTFRRTNRRNTRKTRRENKQTAEFRRQTSVSHNRFTKLG